MKVVKRTKKGVLALAAVSAGVLFCAPSTYADNIYGINYSGGTPLSDQNVRIEPEMLNGLTPLVAGKDYGSIQLETHNLNKGYYKSGDTCHEFYYLKIYDNTQINSSNDAYYTISNDKYAATVRFDNVFLEKGFDGTRDTAVTVGVHSTNQHPYLSAGSVTYLDPTCETQEEDVRAMSRTAGDKLFAQVNVKLSDKTTGELFKSDKLYVDITDIDAAQSYMILNSQDKFAAGKMYSKTAASLQPVEDESSPTGSLRNMFVSDDGYIYSEYNDSGSFATDEQTNIYTQLSLDTQREGLNFVFGFVSAAGSGLKYYAQEYTVNYNSDENGVIAGNDEEEVFSGNVASGSTTTPKDGYELAYWVADVDVTLEDGTVIKAGDKITASQLSEILVEQDIVFTAIHEVDEGEEGTDVVATPDTGAVTGEANAVQITVSIVAVLLVALAAGLAPRVLRKKVNFEK